MFNWLRDEAAAVLNTFDAEAAKVPWTFVVVFGLMALMSLVTAVHVGKGVVKNQRQGRRMFRSTMNAVTAVTIGSIFLAASLYVAKGNRAEMVGELKGRVAGWIGEFEAEAMESPVLANTILIGATVIYVVVVYGLAYQLIKDYRQGRRLKMGLLLLVTFAGFTVLLALASVYTLGLTTGMG
jgi:ABC-type multidrug transport system fused ATPase/permease subunit